MVIMASGIARWRALTRLRTATTTTESRGGVAQHGGHTPNDGLREFAVLFIGTEFQLSRAQIDSLV